MQTVPATAPGTVSELRFITLISGNINQYWLSCLIFDILALKDFKIIKF